MKNIFRRLGITLPAMIFALVATILRSIASITDMDYATGFYGASLTARVANVMMVAAAVLLLATLFIKVENPSLRPTQSGPLGYLPAGVLSISLLFVVIDLFSYVSINLPYITLAAILSHRSYLVAVLTAILAIFTVAFAAVSALVSEQRNLLRALLGMAAALFFGVYAGFCFFRFDGGINQPQKVLTEMAVLSIAVFLLEETRISLGRERWKSYFVFGILSSALAAYTAIPALMVYIFNSKMIAFSLSEILLILAVLVFAVCKLIAAYRFGRNEPSCFVAAICADSTEEISEEADEELAQLSIEDVADDGERQAENEEDSGN